MGYWYWRQLKNGWELNEGTSNKFDLPERGHLSGLAVMLQMYAETNLEDYDNPWPMQRTTVRILGNGNREIIDLRGRQLQALDFWDRGVTPKDNLKTIDAHYTQQFAYIPFGRYMGDLKYGLILQNFKSGVEFEETNTFSTTYYTDTYNKFYIYGLFRKDPEGGLFGGGYLTKKQVLNKDTASETQYGVRLPTDNKIRQIHLFSEPDLSSHLSQTGVFTNLSSIWLGIKSKEEYMIDNISSTYWARFIHDYFARKAQTDIYTSAAGGEAIDTMIYEREGSQATTAQTGANFFIEGGTGMLERCAQIYQYTHAGAASAVGGFFRSTGICYNGQIPLLLNDPKTTDENDWLDSKTDKDVYVEFTEGASTGNIYIVLDELMKSYPA